jgi:hypothetical protein
VLVFVGMPLELAMGWKMRGMPAWPALVSIAVAALLWIPLARARRSATVSQWIFVINNAVIVLALWSRTAYWANEGWVWIPFQAHKLSVITAALIAPGLIPGLVVIAFFGGAAIVQWSLFPAVERASLALGEPWAMLSWSAFAVVLLLSRMRRQNLHLALVLARAEAMTLRRLARHLLAVRDLANTPLQTLEINTALVGSVPGAELYADRMRRSLERLREWQRILETDSVAISGEDPLAFDARRVLGLE